MLPISPYHPEMTILCICLYLQVGWNSTNISSNSIASSFTFFKILKYLPWDTFPCLQDSTRSIRCQSRPEKHSLVRDWSTDSQTEPRFHTPFSSSVPRDLEYEFPTRKSCGCCFSDPFNNQAKISHMQTRITPPHIHTTWSRDVCRRCDPVLCVWESFAWLFIIEWGSLRKTCTKTEVV